PKTSYPVAWTTPALFSGYAATGSVWGAVVQLIGLVVGAAIYLPFVRMADVLSARRSQDVLASLLQIAESAEVSLKGRRCLD
ncbi:hypothetical protein Q6276_30030, partial [Klebsiella variicola]|nr:hypothetical protein [Klebsiella variicola]